MTANKAASETRLRILRKIRRILAKQFYSGTIYSGTITQKFGNELIDFIKAMDERANQRKGGLGRKSTSRRKAMGVI